MFADWKVSFLKKKFVSIQPIPILTFEFIKHNQGPDYV